MRRATAKALMKRSAVLGRGGCAWTWISEVCMAWYEDIAVEDAVYGGGGAAGVLPTLVDVFATALFKGDCSVGDVGSDSVIIITNI